jgi:hypothetical protein
MTWLRSRTPKRSFSRHINDLNHSASKKFRLYWKTLAQQQSKGHYLCHHRFCDTYVKYCSSEIDNVIDAATCNACRYSSLVASGRQIAVLRDHEDYVSSVAFSPDGHTLATGSGDNTARLWEVTSGRQIAVLRDHEDYVSSVAFSPDGRTLATGSGDNTARLWEVEQQRLIDLACARVHFLPLSEKNRQRVGITKEWCTPELSAELRAKLRLDEPETGYALGINAR